MKRTIIITEPIVDLLKDEFVQEKVEEAAKLFYTNDTVTINLYWAAAAALLFFLCESDSPSNPCLALICPLPSADPPAGPAVPAVCCLLQRLRSPLHWVRTSRGQLLGPGPRLRSPRTQLQQICEYRGGKYENHAINAAGKKEILQFLFLLKSNCFVIKLHDFYRLN